VLSYTDTSSPLTAGAAEGLFLHEWASSGALAEARFDETTVLQLA
jgi:hypothetical protein